jgi:response regulator RpfG family c-di-GMP phosphodiesterase
MKIVILDASETSRIKTEDLLTDINVSSVDIYSFDNGADALEFISEEGANIIFSSLELVDMDGVSFTDILLHKFPKMVSKLFITSSSHHSESFKEVKEVGAKRFINKPINEEYFKHFVIPEVNKILLNEAKAL